MTQDEIVHVPTVANLDQHHHVCGPAPNGKKHCQGTDKYQNGASYVDQLQDGKKHCQGTNKYQNGASYVGQLQMARNIARVPTNTETALAMWPVSRWQETWPGYEQIPKRR